MKLKNYLLLILILTLLIPLAILIKKDKGVSEEINSTQNQNSSTEEVVKIDNSVTSTSIPVYKKLININYSKGVIIEPEYLVIHETANTKVGADANAHYRYWSTNPTANASTHFVVDSTQIYQMLELNQMAWHVGDNRGYSDITNKNSIGIEIAVNADGDYEMARQNAINLSIKIMKDLKMDISQLKTHNDASGKNCPTIMLANRPLLDDFYEQVAKGLES
jgi:N-acetylmuramoyl-L-alanine amidase CwlA